MNERYEVNNKGGSDLHEQDNNGGEDTGNFVHKINKNSKFVRLDVNASLYHEAESGANGL